MYIIKRGSGGRKAGDWFGVDSLPTNFVNFSSFLGLPMEWFEKEISSLLKKLELKKRLWGQGFR